VMSVTHRMAVSSFACSAFWAAARTSETDEQPEIKGPDVGALFVCLRRRRA
jgi:hypothetical protein